MTIELQWHDGHRTEGDTWAECFEHLRNEQWHDYTPAEFRAELAARAEAWSGKPAPSTEGTDEDFMRALAAVGMFRIKHE
jgi:hypothetical protein